MKYGPLLILFLFLISCGEKPSDQLDFQQSADDSVDYILNAKGDTFYYGKRYYLPPKFTPLDSLPSPKTVLLKDPKVLKHPFRFPAIITDSIRLSDIIDYKIPGEDGLALPKIEDIQSDTTPLDPPEIVGAPKPEYSSIAPIPIYTFDKVDLGLLQCHSILVDKNGYLWITGGAAKGLIKYDGTHFLNYELGKEIDGGLYQDSEENIWFKSMWGLNTFAFFNKNQIVTFRQSFNVRGNDQAFAEDKNGNYWMSTYSDGLVHFDGKQFVIYNNSSGILSKATRSVSSDEKGKIWIGTRNGISIFDGKGFSNIDLSKLFGSRNINGIHHHKGTHWILAETYGLFKIQGDYLYKYSSSIANREFMAYKMVITDDGRKFIVSSNSGLLEFKEGYFEQISAKNGLKDHDLRDIEIDNNGNLWVSGENIVSKVHLNGIKRIPTFIPFDNSYVASTAIETDGSIYLFGNRGEILKFKDDLIFEYSDFKKDHYSFFWSTVADSDNKIWFSKSGYNSFFGNGLRSLKGNQLKIYSKEYYPSLEPTRIKLSKSGGIWYSLGGLITSGWNKYGGLMKLDDKGLLSYTAQEGMPMPYIGDFIEASDGSIWGGSHNHVCRIKNDSFTIYKFSDNPNVNRVFWMTEAEDGSIFFVSGKGNFCKIKDELIYHYPLPKRNELVSNYIFNIWFDSIGNLWFQDIASLAFLPKNKVHGDIRKKDYYVISSNEGLNNIGMPNPIHRDNQGNRLIPGTKRIVAFNSKEFIPEPREMNLSIHDVLINGASLNKISGKSHYKLTIPEKLRLNYDSNSLEFVFSAIDLNFPHRLKYRYQLTGFDDDWDTTSSARQEYRKLSPGEYSFKVQALGFYNRKSEMREFSFAIIPPWYQTVYAKSAYGLLFLVLIFSFIKWREREIKRKSRKELEASKRLAESEIKSKVLANISHEFRTPLTIIKGVTDKLLLDSPTDPAESAKKIEKQANVLLSLVDKLLNMAKYKEGEAVLEFSQSNMTKQTRLVLAQFESLLKSKNLSVEFVSGLNSDQQVYNPEAFETILKNLLSNAIKFSDKVAKISIKLFGDSGHIILKVSDQGIGIPKEHLDKIFDRFFQSHPRSDIQGTGIGLSMVRELVSWHKGKIEVNSEIHKGSTFIVRIPDNLSPAQQSINKKETPGKKLSESDDVLVLEETTQDDTQSKQSILVVEDNPDLMEMMEDMLSSSYEVLRAENGIRALQICRENTPDFIVTDIMMPEMDGLTFCRELKQNEELAHIPVVMLTAKASEDDKIEGLKAGAHDFLSKPFNREELMVKVDNILSERSNLYRKIQKDPAFLFTTESPLLKNDNRFINKLKKLIEDNYSNPEYGLDWYAENLNMARSSFTRKIKNVSGLTFIEYLRKYKLNRASQLLRNKEIQVSEVCFKVGYNNPSFFVKSFKKEFGITPKEFQNQNSELN